MKKINYIFVIFLSVAINLSNAVHAQVSINTSGNDPDASSILDVSSDTHGVLIPRMTLTERGNIDLTGSPTGLIIYQTDNTPGFYYYDGSSWTAIQGGNDNDWTVIGNDMYSAVSGNVGIGTTIPSTIFEIASDEPYITLRNTTAGDTDFGRNGELVCKGEQSGGEISKLGILKFSHDGTGDDQNGRFEIKVNDGNDGNSPNTMLRIDENYGIATGFLATASGDYSTALGAYTNASGYSSTAMGYSTTASESYSTALGVNTNASGYSSTAMGEHTTASGGYSTAMGIDCYASGYYSMAMGRDIKVSGENSFGIALSDMNGHNVTQSNVMAIMGGNVGIGNSSPSYKLDVSGDINFSGSLYQNGSLFSSTGGDFANGGESVGTDRTLGNTDNYALGFLTNNSTRLHIANSGNVGIGDSSPSYKLDVSGDINFTGSLYQNGNLFSSTGGDFANGGESGSADRTLGNTDNYALGFLTNNSTRLHIANSGNIGIGTAAPSQKLHIKGSTSTDAVLYLEPSEWNSSGDYAEIRFGDESHYIRGEHTTGMTFYDTDNFSFSGGNVGIGTNNPSCPLEVNGSSSLNATFGYLNSSGNTGTSGPSDNDYSIKASHRIMASEFNAVSDRRIKTNILGSKGTSDLQKINKLKVSEYNYVDSIGKGNTLQKGFIAQEVEQIIPEAVHTHSDFIPNVFTLATNLTKTENIVTIELPKKHQLSQGDLIRLITPVGQLDKEVLMIVSSNSFSVSMSEEPESIFVYGKKVDDFRVVNYDYIFSTGIGAIQELSKKVKELENSNNYLQSKVEQIDKLTAEVEVLKSLIVRENN